MATDQRTLPAYFSAGDTDFRAWGSGINAQLAACELVQTTDTGQINWTTVTHPAGTNTSAGYEIWKINDALPYTVYLKVEYGTGGAADRPSLWLTAGSGGTDGAGTLQAPVGTRRQIAAQASKTAGVTLDSYCSGSSSDGRITLVTNFDPADDNYCCGFSVERMRDGSGDGTGLVNATLTWAPAAGFSYQPLPYTGSVPAATATMPFAPYIAALTQFGGYTSLVPHSYAVGKTYWGMTQLMYQGGDLTDLTPISVTHLDGAHVYMPMGSGAGNWSSGTTYLAMIWE